MGTRDMGTQGVKPSRTVREEMQRIAATRHHDPRHRLSGKPRLARGAAMLAQIPKGALQWQTHVQ